MDGRNRWVKVAVVGLTAVILGGCGRSDPHLVGNMPTPVRRVARSAAPSGMDLATAMLVVTGNRTDIKLGYLPGTYLYGPESGQSDIYVVEFEIPINMAGIKRWLGALPKEHPASSVPGDNYISIPPLNRGNFDKLYFNPDTKRASFVFKLMPNGRVLVRSWDAVMVDG